MATRIARGLSRVLGAGQKGVVHRVLSTFAAPASVSHFTQMVKFICSFSNHFYSNVRVHSFPLLGPAKVFRGTSHLSRMRINQHQRQWIPFVKYLSEISTSAQATMTYTTCFQNMAKSRSVSSGAVVFGAQTILIIEVIG
jgi:hypothetical protein